MDDTTDLPITDQDYENHWLWRDSLFSLPDSELQKYVGFVYLIQCLAPDKMGKAYVGQKTLWKRVKRVQTHPRTKKKRTVKVQVPSDWKKYYGSNEELNEDVKKYGPEFFTREVLHLCESKGSMNYVELKEQVDRKVLFSDKFYNSFIGKKIHRSHVSKVADEQR